MIDDERLTKELIETYERLRVEGEILSPAQLDYYYAIFRDRFGPARLQSLDGEALLYTMKALGEEHRDSLVYWLEFKNDDEFPTLAFGSISGGSALKYGVYPRKEDGAWMTGSSHKQVEVSPAQATEIARAHRDQLLQGVDLLETLGPHEGDEAYRWLQEEMEQVAPDISNSAWAHKYFSLLFPDKLDDFHVERYQRFHLIKLLQLPPEGDGRYLAAGRFIAIAHHLNVPTNHLMKILNERNGRPYRYWRIGTKLGGERSIWERMRQEGNVAIGWPDIGDLSYVTYDRDSKERIRAALETYYPNDPRVIGRKTQEIFNFVTKISDGDLVLPSDGRRVLGVGRVIGDYAFVGGSDAPHRRPVEWLSFESWQIPEDEGLRTTVFPLRKHDVNLIEAERRLLAPPPTKKTPIAAQEETAPLRLPGIPGQIQSVLARKKQVILYGPPGTGKTYWAGETAQDLAAHSRFGRRFSELTEEEQASLRQGTEAQIRMCTFHPAYGYEDFLEGYRPDTVANQLVFARRDGVFKRLCWDATQQSEQNFYLIIDEINRGDIPRIFGELLTVLEKDKRDQEILLPLSGESFAVPDNVYVIATMNTADRSIALLDTALRRRFGFIEIMPDIKVLSGRVVANSIPLGPWLAALNERILNHIGRDARNLQIGHAYLLEDGQPVTDFNHFARILRDDIIPLLQEYCYEDYATLATILGENLVDQQRQRIRHDLFKPERQDDLIQALLEPTPDLMATTDVVASEAASEELDEEEDVAVDEEGETG